MLLNHSGQCGNILVPQNVIYVYRSFLFYHQMNEFNRTVVKIKCAGLILWSDSSSCFTISNVNNQLTCMIIWADYMMYPHTKLTVKHVSQLKKNIITCTN